jgi:hypothetical protein
MFNGVMVAHFLTGRPVNPYASILKHKSTHPKMKDSSCVFFVALLGFASILATISQECPRLFLTANARPNPRRGIVAGKGMARITVILKSNDPVDNVEFHLNLPDGLSVEQTAMRPSSKPYTPPQIVEDADGATAISWQGLAFTKRKGGKGRFRVKVKADQCAPETLAVDAFTYLMNAIDTSCITPLANPAIVKVRYLKRNKNATSPPSSNLATKWHLEEGRSCPEDEGPAKVSLCHASWFRSVGDHAKTPKLCGFMLGLARNGQLYGVTSNLLR